MLLVLNKLTVKGNGKLPKGKNWEDNRSTLENPWESLMQFKYSFQNLNMTLFNKHCKLWSKINFWSKISNFLIYWTNILCIVYVTYSSAYKFRKIYLKFWNLHKQINLWWNMFIDHNTNTVMSSRSPHTVYALKIVTSEEPRTPPVLHNFNFPFPWFPNKTIKTPFFLFSFF